MRRTIPIAPHVKQFLISIYGPEPIHVSNNNKLGKLISICSERFYKVCPEPKMDLRKGFTLLEIALPKELKHAKFSEEKLYMVADFLEKDFRDYFLAHTSGCLNPQTSEWAAAESFLSSYNIDPELFDRDALRKIWQRWEKKKEALQAAGLVSTEASNYRMAG